MSPRPKKKRISPDRSESNCVAVEDALKIQTLSFDDIEFCNICN